MKLLLDTHTFLWFIGGDTNLSGTAKSIIMDRTTSRLLSIASLWEIAIKINARKLQIGMSFEELHSKYIYGNGISLLTIELEHLDAFTTLPLHHRDPFDRLIIAQAQSENIPILSRDGTFDQYNVRRIWL